MAIDTKTRELSTTKSKQYINCVGEDSPESSCQLPTTPAQFLMQPEDYIELKERLIPLTQGKFAIVDEEDYESLIEHKWTLLKGLTNYYAYRAICLTNPDEQINITMHQQILNPPEGYEIDHINHNGLDNRRCNIRICTHSQNMQNSRKSKGKSSIFKGVSIPTQYQKNRYGKKWTAQININGKTISLGFFGSEIEAAKTYDEFARKHYGEFAYTNF